jgi:hypothetical protein
VDGDCKRDDDAEEEEAVLDMTNDKRHACTHTDEESWKKEQAKA